jgi:ankyrin repeat protein
MKQTRRLYKKQTRKKGSFRTEKRKHHKTKRRSYKKVKGGDKTAELLFDAIKNDNTEDILKLINDGPDVNARDEDGNTPLHIVCKNTKITEENKARIVNALISKGAVVNAKNKYGNTPLHFECWYNTKKANTWSLNVYEILLSNGADVNAQNDEGWTPLHIACEAEQYDIVMSLLRYNADTNIRTNEEKKIPISYVGVASPIKYLFKKKKEELKEKAAKLKAEEESSRPTSRRISSYISGLFSRNPRSKTNKPSLTQPLIDSNSVKSPIHTPR